MRRFRRVIALLAVIVATLGVGIPAEAGGTDGGVGVITGTGNVLPGLTVTPTIQVYGMNGVATLVDANGSGSVFCAIAGASAVVGETIAEGAGTMRLVCGSLTANVCVYTRVIFTFTFACADTTTGVEASGVLTLEPGDVPPAPINNYAFVGIIAVVRIVVSPCTNVICP